MYTLHIHIYSYLHRITPHASRVFPASPGPGTVSCGCASTWCSACPQRTRSFSGCRARVPAMAGGAASPGAANGGNAGVHHQNLDFLDDLNKKYTVYDSICMTI